MNRGVLARRPASSGGVLVGLLVGVWWALHLVIDGYGDWPAALAVGAILGALLGTGLGLFMYRQLRRLYGGPPSHAQRAAVAAALTRLRPPDDPRLREVSLRVARMQADRSVSPPVVLAVLGVLLCLGIVLGLLGQPDGWLDAALVVLLGPGLFVISRRTHARARRYLAVVG